MGVLFAIGSTCFAVASFISQWASVPRPGLGVTFFVGSIFFTSAAFLQLRLSETPADRRASLIQFVGTLFFNVSTFMGMQKGFDAKQTDLRVWAPDVFGSICFLVSSWFAYVIVRRPSLEWRVAALNLLGSIFFGISAIAALVQPSTSEPVSAAIANAGTTAGAVCFFAGAVMLIPKAAAPAPAA
jgi:multisubunit Na+/H+ antiporter MnhF subunit